MNTFMLQSDIEPVLSAIGFAGIRVDMSDAAMDAHQFTDDDIGTPPHAIVHSSTPLTLDTPRCTQMPLPRLLM